MEGKLTFTVVLQYRSGLDTVWQTFEKPLEAFQCAADMMGRFPPDVLAGVSVQYSITKMNPVQQPVVAPESPVEEILAPVADFLKDNEVMG